MFKQSDSFGSKPVYLNTTIYTHNYDMGVQFARNKIQDSSLSTIAMGYGFKNPTELLGNNSFRAHTYDMSHLMMDNVLTLVDDYKSIGVNHLVIYAVDKDREEIEDMCKRLITLNSLMELNIYLVLDISMFESSKDKVVDKGFMLPLVLSEKYLIINKDKVSLYNCK